MRIYPEGFNQNTNKELNKVSLKGDIGKADVSYINIYRPTTEIELTEAIKDKQIVLVSINSILLEEGKDYKVSEDKKKIVSLTPDKPWCPNGVTKTAIVEVYTIKETEKALTVGDNDV